MRRKLTLKINGKDHEIDLPVQRLLVDLLREDLGLTGTKLGCGEGECGACTVLVDGKAVTSCITLAASLEGCEITTIEGLAEGGRLHPLQETFIAQGAAQCGFCTPGMILSAKALLDHHAHPDEHEIKEALSGNLCRCTGYAAIIRAVRAASDARRSL